MFSEKALQKHFDYQLLSAVGSDSRIPPDMRQPPYTPAALATMVRRHIQWEPTCPKCSMGIPTAPQEVKKLTELTKDIVALAAGVGLSLEKECQETTTPLWDLFFELRRRV